MCSVRSCLYEKKSSHPRETSHLSEILAEWYILLCKIKSFMRIDSSHPGEISPQRR